MFEMFDFFGKYRGCCLTLEPACKMARVTGLEPAASSVTGKRSNQLSYTRSLLRGLL